MVVRALITCTILGHIVTGKWALLLDTCSPLIGRVWNLIIWTERASTVSVDSLVRWTGSPCTSLLVFWIGGSIVWAVTALTIIWKYLICITSRFYTILLVDICFEGLRALYTESISWYCLKGVAHFLVAAWFVSAWNVIVWACLTLSFKVNLGSSNTVAWNAWFLITSWCCVLWTVLASSVPQNSLRRPTIFLDTVLLIWWSDIVVLAAQASRLLCDYLSISTLFKHTALLIVGSNMVVWARFAGATCSNLLTDKAGCDHTASLVSWSLLAI